MGKIGPPGLTDTKEAEKAIMRAVRAGGRLGLSRDRSWPPVREIAKPVDTIR